MDTTLKYIKMCNCPEIQGQWKPKWGDFISDDGLIFPLSTVRIDKEDVIWLPRQDQLQEMVWTPLMSNYRCAGDLIEALTRFIDNVPMNNTTYDMYSMEQLWLAYVMHEKFNKVWDEEKEEWTEDNL